MDKTKNAKPKKGNKQDKDKKCIKRDKCDQKNGEKMKKVKLKKGHKKEEDEECIIGSKRGR